MRPIESKFKIHAEELNQHNYFNKLTDERALFEVYPNLIDYQMLEPERRKIASYAKGNIIGKDGTLMKVFADNARIENTNAQYIRWRLYTKEGDIRGTYLKNLEPNNPAPGKAGALFSIPLDVDWFGPNDIIIFEGLREIPLLIQSHPEPELHGWKYDVKLLEDDDNQYFPLSYIEVGTRVIQIGSLIGEATVERGNIHFGDGDSYIEFEVPMTRMGWEMKITDKAQMASKNYRLMAATPDMVDKVGNEPILINSLELKFMNAVNFQKDMWLTYGRSAGRFAGKFLDGITENPLQTGPGFFELLESSNILEYSPDAGSIDIFREFLPPLWNDKVDPADRVVDIYTGTAGLILWQKWCKAADIEGVLQTAEYNYSDEPALFAGKKGVGIGVKQYRSVFLEPFGKVTVHHLPFLDSEHVETRKYKGYPYSSYEFIIFNYGYGDVRQDNIKILRNDQMEQWGYTVSTWTPTGGALKAGNRNRYHSSGMRENAFWYIHETALGFVVKDPGYMAWIRPALS